MTRRLNGMRTSRAVLTATAALLVAAVVLGGCGNDDDSVGTKPTDTTNTTPTVTLDDHTYIANSITVDGKQHAIVDGTTITLVFANGRIGITAGCNSMSGSFTVNGSTLTVNAMAMTEMACADDRMAQDDFVAAVFAEPVTVAQDGATLTITSKGTVMNLSEKPPTPDAALVGTVWLLDSVGDDTTASSTDLPRQPQLTIDTDGRASVFFGCNSGGGPVEVGDATLSFGSLSMTRMACPDRQMEVEQTVADFLKGEVEFRITGNQLTLTKGTDSLVWGAGQA